MPPCIRGIQSILPARAGQGDFGAEALLVNALLAGYRQMLFWKGELAFTWKEHGPFLIRVMRVRISPAPKIWGFC